MIANWMEPMDPMNENHIPGVSFHRVALGRDVHVATDHGIGDAQDPLRPLWLQGV